MYRAFSTLLVSLTVVFSVWFAIGKSTAAAATVWSGLTKTFTKPGGADPTLPENQDQITPNVALTRGIAPGVGDGLGLFNAATETYYTYAGSPDGTEWATDLPNDPNDPNTGKTIAATNWANLTFGSWRDAYGASGSLVSNITNIPAVVHLIQDDIYLDLQFTAWGVTPGSEGSLSYLRSVPEPATIVIALIGAAFLVCKRRA